MFIPSAAVTSAGAAVIVVSPTQQKADSSSPVPGTCINSMPHLLTHELQLHFVCRYGLFDHHLRKALEPFLLLDGIYYPIIGDGPLQVTHVHNLLFSLHATELPMAAHSRLSLLYLPMTFQNFRNVIFIAATWHQPLPVWPWPLHGTRTPIGSLIHWPLPIQLNPFFK